MRTNCFRMRRSFSAEQKLRRAEVMTAIAACRTMSTFICTAKLLHKHFARLQTDLIMVSHDPKGAPIPSHTEKD